MENRWAVSLGQLAWRYGFAGECLATAAAPMHHHLLLLLVTRMDVSLSMWAKHRAPWEGRACLAPVVGCRCVILMLCTHLATSTCAWGRLEGATYAGTKWSSWGLEKGFVLHLGQRF